MHLIDDEGPMETCPIHGCRLHPARPIPCPMCEEQAEEEYGIER